MPQNKFYQINPEICLQVWYDRQTRVWWAAYYEGSETPSGVPIHWQVGDAWHGPSRDYVLIHRPATPQR